MDDGEELCLGIIIPMSSVLGQRMGKRVALYCWRCPHGRGFPLLVFSFTHHRELNTGAYFVYLYFSL